MFVVFIALSACSALVVPAVLSHDYFARCLELLLGRGRCSKACSHGSFRVLSFTAMSRIFWPKLTSTWLQLIWLFFSRGGCHHFHHIVSFYFLWRPFSCCGLHFIASLFFFLSYYSVASLSTSGPLTFFARCVDTAHLRFCKRCWCLLFALRPQRATLATLSLLSLGSAGGIGSVPMLSWALRCRASFSLGGFHLVADYVLTVLRVRGSFFWVGGSLLTRFASRIYLCMMRITARCSAGSGAFVVCFVRLSQLLSAFGGGGCVLTCVDTIGLAFLVGVCGPSMRFIGCCSCPGWGLVFSVPGHSVILWLSPRRWLPFPRLHSAYVQLSLTLWALALFGGSSIVLLLLASVFPRPVPSQLLLPTLEARYCWSAVRAVGLCFLPLYPRCLFFIRLFYPPLTTLRHGLGVVPWPVCFVYLQFLSSFHSPVCTALHPRISTSCRGLLPARLPRHVRVCRQFTPPHLPFVSFGFSLSVSYLTRFRCFSALRRLSARGCPLVSPTHGLFCFGSSSNRGVLGLSP